MPALLKVKLHIDLKQLDLKHQIPTGKRNIRVSAAGSFMFELKKEVLDKAGTCNMRGLICTDLRESKQLYTKTNISHHLKVHQKEMLNASRRYYEIKRIGGSTRCYI